MVARSPPKLNKMVAPINPLLLRETLAKVDQCMSRLQELQHTVSGGTKMLSGINLSPRSTRGYLRIMNATTKKSPAGKYPTNMGADWRRMSLPAMLLGETVGEIIQASQFAKEIVEAANAKSRGATTDDPKTPVSQRRKQRPNPDKTELRTRRKREKQSTSQSIRPASPEQLQRVRSRINFKVSSSPPKKIQSDNENARYLANRVSPKLKPWAKKAVLFPNPLFLSTPAKTEHQKFCKTRTPIIARKRETPHKFLIKSPAKVGSGCISPKLAGAKVVGSSASKLRRSFSPSRLASRLVSPLKNRKSVEKVGGGEGLVMMSGLKRPVLVSMTHSTGGGWRD